MKPSFTPEGECQSLSFCAINSLDVNIHANDRLTFGTLYPAYRSYKAIKNKDVREYVKWMMYWVIFALFTAVETFADVLLSWLPLYYEIKIVFFIWLLSPATKGSSILYRKFVHPRLVRHEKAIDKYISQAQKNSYAMLMDAGKRGFSVAADTFVKTAVSGQYQLVETLKRYNSMQELRNTNDETDAIGNTNNSLQRSTWYDGMPQGYNSDGSNYDPENDVRILERQYKHTATGEIINEETIQEDSDLQRSQSDIDLMNPQPYEGSMSKARSQTSPKQSSEKKDDHSQDIDYSYQYSSNTLPRARKAKKPIHENRSRWSVGIDDFEYPGYSSRRLSDNNPYLLRSHSGTSFKSKYTS